MKYILTIFDGDDNKLVMTKEFNSEDEYLKWKRDNYFILPNDEE